MHVPQVIHQNNATVGDMGQEYLACGKAVAMRRWEEPAGEQCESSDRDYEIVGYLLKGTLELTLDGEPASLSPGDS